MNDYHNNCNQPYERHELVIKLLIKQVEDGVCLLNYIQEVQVGIFGISRGNCCRIKTENK